MSGLMKGFPKLLEEPVKRFQLEPDILPDEARDLAISFRDKLHIVVHNLTLNSVLEALKLVSLRQKLEVAEVDMLA